MNTLIIIFSLPGITFIGCAYMWVRNDWVCKVRLQIIQDALRNLDGMCKEEAERTGQTTPIN